MIAPRDGEWRAARRGSAYALVLGLATVLAVAGMGALSVARLRTREVARANAWEEAGLLAYSAVEHGILQMTREPAWRTTSISGVPSPQLVLGRGTYSWTYIDEIDGDLADDTSHPVRVLGVGRVGDTSRYYVAYAAPQGGAAPPWLKTAVHAGGAVETRDQVGVSGGPISTNATLTNRNVLAGGAEALDIVNLGTIKGRVVTPAPAKPLPPASIFDTYWGLATNIPWSAVPSGRFENTVVSRSAMSPAYPSARGIWRVRVPSGSTLVVRRSRLEATMVIELDANATLRLSDEVLWEPGQADQPALLVRGAAGSIIDMDPTGADLSEPIAGRNFNPPGTPYLGAEDNDTADAYPSEVRGLVHVVGAASRTNLRGQFRLRGTLVTEGLLFMSDSAMVRADPALANDPPFGYAEPAAPMRPVPGSWRWVAAP